MKRILLITLISFFALTGQIYAQQLDSMIALEIANAYINDHLQEWKLTPEDVAGRQISDMYTDRTSGITRIYFQQYHEGIPVYNAILNFNITKEGEVYFAGNRFIGQLATKINTSTPSVSAQEAVLRLCDHLGLARRDFKLLRQTGTTGFVFEKNSITAADVEATLTYQLLDNKVLLAWDILLEPAINHDKWSTRIDASNGAVLHETNWTFYCGTELTSNLDAGDDCSAPTVFSPGPETTSSGAQYTVWPFPNESPGHGDRQLVVDPADTIASPFGWHDVNGDEGADYTITYGNNVFAYHGRNDLGYSEGDEPNGGNELHFNFPFDPLMEPEQQIEASVVNLFYAINFMHDFAYRFGFDEAAGNFQYNNYGKGGIGNDNMYGVAQSGANTGLKNNAFYKHGNEGKSGYIHMFVFTDKKKFLTVNAPANIVSAYFTSLPSDGWGEGAYIDSIGVTGEVVLLNDGIANPSTSDGCEDIINADELAGKIVFIERGGCQFAYKALKAQEAGAIGIIIANFDDGEYNLNPGDEAAMVNIPVVMITASDAHLLRNYIGSGLQVSLVDPGEEIPKVLDSAFDNGLIAHEFGHGISNRLAGGPDRLCLDNAENMTEGWSDFFALVTTVKAGDTGDMESGLNTYLSKDPLTGKGFRRFPYSTDMSVMPLTYGDLAIGQEVHDQGEVWACMLWDMYWALVEAYGWNENMYDTTSGNYKAIRLVMDGLKNIACDPGFVDGRDAILAADEALYGGENKCLLWKVFARRGLGYSADQGSPYHAGDQREAFDVLPLCTDQLLITKSVDELITAGEDIEVILTVGNYKQPLATHVVVVDEIPAGTTFKVSSSNLPATVNGNTVTFDLGDMPFGEATTVTYTLESDPNAWSNRFYLDTASTASNNQWLTYPIDFDGGNYWVISDSSAAHSGNYYWYTAETYERSRQALELNPEVFTFYVTGDQPVLRFYHKYKTYHVLNGGVVEVREVGAPDWTQVGDDMFRNGYTGELDYRTFAYPNIRAFSGVSGNGYQATYVDLHQWIGKAIQIRFKFGTWPVASYTYNGSGWLIDDVEFMDMLSYNSEACASDDQGDLTCAVAPGRGTVVDTQDKPVSVDPDVQDLSFSIFPNPANEYITAIIKGNQPHVDFRLLTLDGRPLYTECVLDGADTFLHIDTRDIPPGMYIAQLSTAAGMQAQKVVLQR